eukprot:CAMPEP_0119127004 /NCGR_PEP_ID=MMETSP1310-20130426/5708_1 /TAXON_ID=464262 /ORGANISM="Genus nov. species nov., Strain RCC2339" /LENGTH=927 /DNA_ID=CAMNT_0007117215 /DNA_START=173 /DNA_END=2956 /DNA_ORIENTATION=+
MAVVIKRARGRVMDSLLVLWLSGLAATTMGWRISGGGYGTDVRGNIMSSRDLFHYGPDGTPRLVVGRDDRGLAYVRGRETQDGMPDFTDRAVSYINDHGQATVRVAMLASGRPAVVVCSAVDTLLYQYALDDEGRTWSPPELLADGCNRGADVTVGGGRPVVVYGAGVNGVTDHYRSKIYLRFAADDLGTNWNPPVLLHSDEDGFGGEYLGMAYHAVSSTVGVTWTTDPADTYSDRSRLLFCHGIDASGNCSAYPPVLLPEMKTCGQPLALEATAETATASWLFATRMYGRTVRVDQVDGALVSTTVTQPPPPDDRSLYLHCEQLNLGMSESTPVLVAQEDGYTDHQFLHFAMALDPLGAAWPARPTFVAPVTTTRMGFPVAVAVRRGVPLLYAYDENPVVFAPADGAGTEWPANSTARVPGFGLHGELYAACSAVAIGSSNLVAGCTSISDVHDVALYWTMAVEGTAWTEPELVFVIPGAVEKNPGRVYVAALETARGAPAFLVLVGGVVYYVEANAEGDWEPPRGVGDFGTDAITQSFSATIASGAPAYLYCEMFIPGSTCYYSRMSGPDGAWSEPVAVPFLDEVKKFPYGACLATVAGRPAIAYRYEWDGFPTVMYQQAEDAAGERWDAPPVVASVEDCTLEGEFSSFVVKLVEGADGSPVIAAVGCSGGDWNVIVSATNVSNGSHTTFLDYPLDWAINGFIDLQLVDGNPAVVFATTSGLWYRRASDVTGTVWDDPAVLVLSDPGGVEVNPSNVFNFKTRKPWYRPLAIANSRSGRTAVLQLLTGGIYVVDQAGDPLTPAYYEFPGFTTNVTATPPIPVPLSPAPAPSETASVPGHRELVAAGAAGVVVVVLIATALAVWVVRRKQRTKQRAEEDTQLLLESDYQDLLSEEDTGPFRETSDGDWTQSDGLFDDDMDKEEDLEY